MLAKEETLLTYAEAAELIGITEGTLRGAVSHGKIRPVKVPGDRKKYFRRSDAAAYRTAPGEKPVETQRPMSEHVTLTSADEIGQRTRFALDITSGVLERLESGLTQYRSMTESTMKAMIAAGATMYHEAIGAGASNNPK